MNQATNSIVGSANVIRKVYFPRLLIPISAVLAGGVDFALAFVVLLGMMLFYGLVPTLAIFWLPLFLLLALTTALGVSLWVTALNTQFRDVRYAVPFLVQAWMFATPIAYPTPSRKKRPSSWNIARWLPSRRSTRAPMATMPP